MKPDYSQEVLWEKLNKDLTLKPVILRQVDIKTSFANFNLSEINPETIGTTILKDISANVFLNNISDKLAARIIADGTLQYCKDSKTLSKWLRRESE